MMNRGRVKLSASGLPDDAHTTAFVILHSRPIALPMSSVCFSQFDESNSDKHRRRPHYTAPTILKRTIQSKLRKVWMPAVVGSVGARVSNVQAFAHKAEFLENFQPDLPCPVPIEKFFALPVGQIISTSPRHPVSQEGRLAIVTDVETGCGGRKLRY